MDGKTGQTLLKTVLAADDARAPPARSRVGTRPTSSATTTASFSIRRARTRRRCCPSRRCSTRSSAITLRTTRCTSTTTSPAATRKRPGTTSTSWGSPACHADQGRLPLPGLRARRAARRRSRALARRREDRRRVRNSAAAVDVLQVAVPRRGGDAGARLFKQERLLIDWAKENGTKARQAAGRSSRANGSNGAHAAGSNGLSHAKGAALHSAGDGGE